MAENAVPEKVWIKKTFQVKQYEPVDLYAEMTLIPTGKGKYITEDGKTIDSKEDAYLELLNLIHDVWEKYKVMLKERRERKKSEKEDKG